MPEASDVVARTNALSEVEAYRLIQKMALTGHGLWLADATGANGCKAIVIDQIDEADYRLLLLQPEHIADGPVMFSADRQVILQWSHGGICYRASGRVARVNVPPHSYEVRLDNDIYHEQRRANRRISIGPDESITAQLYVDGMGELRDATVQNLSVSGCRLAVDIQGLRFTEPEPHHRSFINLVLRSGAQPVSNETRIVWAARTAAHTMHISVVWIDPSPTFSAAVHDYVMARLSG